MDEGNKRADSPERLREVVLDLELAKVRERELREEATALLTGLSAITDSTSGAEIFERLLDALRVPFGFDAAFVLRPDPEGVLVVDTATDPVFHGARFVAAKGFERALRGRVTTHLDATAMEEWQRQPEEVRSRVGSALCLPLKGERERALIVFTHGDARAFQPRHEQLARRFLPLATQALRDAERRSQLTQANRSMRLVLDNVAQGLLMVGRDRVVASERSAILDRWFGAAPPGVTLDELIARKNEPLGAELASAWEALVLASSATEPELAKLPRRLEASGLTLQIDYRPVPSPESWEHMLVVLSDVSAEIERARLEAEAKEVLRQGELSIAQRVQTSLLPRSLEFPGLEMAARMLPAEEVGGDYYDVIPVEGGCWLGIGDVSGHGLSAGLIMLMVQSAIGALVREDPAASPRDLLIALNAMLFDNIRRRLGDSDHVTLSLLRYGEDGHFAIAGAHEDVVVFRAATKRCELLATSGTWLGGMANVAPFTTDASHRLAPGDMLWLYTDGLTEAMTGLDREQFGLDRLCEIIEASHSESMLSIRDRILEALRVWSPSLADDVTILGARRTGPA